MAGRKRPRKKVIDEKMADGEKPKEKIEKIII